MNAVANTFLLLAVVLQSAFGSSGMFGRLQTSLQAAVSPKLPDSKSVAYIPEKYQTEPVLKAASTAYTPSAVSAVVYDVTSGKVLVSKNASSELPMASLTKLMTVLTILQSHNNLDEVVTIPEELPVLGATDQKIGVVTGEEFYLRDMLKATLIYSANDVANSLAIWDSGSIEKFATKMNSQAETWGLSSSNFVNPSGLDVADHYSSAEDLLTLSTILLQSPLVRTMVNTERTSITSLTGKPYVLTTTNQSLNLPSVYGLKTGQTIGAGQCLILLGRNKAGHEIITIVLNSPNRFQESQNMVNYVFNNYIWK